MLVALRTTVVVVIIFPDVFGGLDDLLEQVHAEIAHSTGRSAAPLDRITRLRPPLNRSAVEPPNGDSA